MGQLSVTVGPLSKSLSFDDTRGTAIINGFIAAQGGPVNGTNAEKLQWFADRLGEYARDVYRQAEKRAAVESAAAAVEGSLEQW